MFKEFLKSKTAQSSLRLIVLIIAVFGFIPIIITQCATQIITAIQTDIAVFEPNWVAIGALITAVVALIPTQKKLTEAKGEEKDE